MIRWRARRDLEPVGLDPSWLRHEARKDPVIVAETNSLFHGLTRWWIGNMKEVVPPIKKFQLVALDPEEYRRLKELNQTVLYDKGVNMNTTKSVFRNKEYNEIVHFKWKVVVDILKDKRDVLLSDVDIFWRRNPLAYLQTLPKCDIYACTDVPYLPRDSKGGYRLTAPLPGRGMTNWLNTGFIMLRSNARVMKLAQRVRDNPIPGFDDQWTFNVYLEELLTANPNASSTGHSPNECAHYGDLTFFILPPDLFMNKRIYEAHPTFNNPYSIHFNYLGSHRQKVRYLVSKGFMSREYASPEDLKGRIWPWEFWWS
jgi:hypothetical protein